MPGIQWPPSYGGSSHSNNRTLGRLLLVALDTVLVSSFRLARNSSRIFTPRSWTPQASATVTKVSATSSRVSGSSERTLTPPSEEPPSTSAFFTSSVDGAHTPHKFCVSTTVGLASLSASRSMGYKLWTVSATSAAPDADGRGHVIDDAASAAAFFTLASMSP